MIPYNLATQPIQNYQPRRDRFELPAGLGTKYITVWRSDTIDEYLNQDCTDKMGRSVRFGEGDRPMHYAIYVDGRRAGADQDETALIDWLTRYEVKPNEEKALPRATKRVSLAGSRLTFEDDEERDDAAAILEREGMSGLRPQLSKARLWLDFTDPQTAKDALDILWDEGGFKAAAGGSPLKGLTEQQLQEWAGKIRGELMNYASRCDALANSAQQLGPDGSQYVDGFRQTEQYIDLARKQLYNLY